VRHSFLGFKVSFAYLLITKKLKSRQFTSQVKLFQQHYRDNLKSKKKAATQLVYFRVTV
jgi:hypothetical protein